MILAILLAVSFQSVPSVFANPQNNSTKPIYADIEKTNPKQNPKESSPWIERKVYGFAGFDLGVSNYSAFSSAKDQGSRSGFHGGLRALAALYFHRFVWDNGLGWHRISNSGSNIDGTKTEVTTSGFYLETSPRYRLTRALQLGPVIDYWLTTDNGINPNALSSTSNHGLFFGAQLVYEWMNHDQKLRIGGRYLTDMNVDGRNVNILQAFFQFGFDWFGEKSSVSSEMDYRSGEGLEQSDIDQAEVLNEVPLSREPILSEEADAEDVLGDPIDMATPTPAPTLPPPAPVTENKPDHKPKAVFVVTLKESSLPFATNSAKLPADTMKEVRDTGKFLGKNSSQWKSLVVKGHTDSRGKPAYNMKLSKLRADAVKKLLVAGGAPAKKIKSIGFGSKKPIDRASNQQAWAKNRRVELEFIGVKDAALINDGVTIGK